MYDFSKIEAGKMNIVPAEYDRSVCLSVSVRDTGIGIRPEDTYA